jgi:hypothetical protein
VVPHVLLWNGVADTPFNDNAWSVNVYDVPVDCATVRHGNRPPPVGAKLHVEIHPSHWRAGSTNAELYPEALDAHLGYSMIRVDLEKGTVDQPRFEVLSAPTANGSRGRVRLEMRIEFLREPPESEQTHDVARVDVISGEFDVELCGDLVEPEPLPTPHR